MAFAAHARNTPQSRWHVSSLGSVRSRLMSAPTCVPSAAFLTALHISSGDVSGDAANYPVCTTNIITALWEVAGRVCLCGY